MQTHSENLVICKPEREFSPEPDHGGTLILNFQLPEQWENRFLSFTPPNLWYFIMAAWTKTAEYLSKLFWWQVTETQLELVREKWIFLQETLAGLNNLNKKRLGVGGKLLASACCLTTSPQSAVACLTLGSGRQRSGSQGMREEN